MMRFERKYRIEGIHLTAVKECLAQNPACFSLAYPDRRVNSIYFDDANFDALNENFAGIGFRRKYRIRWYGTDLKFLKKPVLETKIKVNKLGYKKHQPLDSMVFSDMRERAMRLESIRSRNLKPNVIVSYDRTYYLSQDKLVRATVDRNLAYFSLANSVIEPIPATDPAIILEIKYAEHDESLADNYMQAIPYRLSKNSKYATAVARLWS